MKDLRRFLKYLRPHRLTFVIALIAMIFTALFETATLALLAPLFDQFQSTLPENTTTLFNLHKLIPKNPWYQAWLMISILMLTFTICKGIAQYFSAYFMAKIGQAAILQLRNELYSHLLNQSASFFEKHRTNFLVSRLVTSCAAIEFAISSNLRDVLRESLMLVFFITAAFYFNWRMMLGALTLGPILALFTARISKSLRRLADVSLKGNQKLTDSAQEALSNQAIVKAYSAEERENVRFSKVAELIARANLRSGKIAAISPSIIESIGVIVLVILFFFGLRSINLGKPIHPSFLPFYYFCSEAMIRCAGFHANIMNFPKRLPPLRMSGKCSMIPHLCPKKKIP